MNTKKSSIQSEMRKPSYPLVELGGLLWIIDYEGNVPEFQRADAEMRQMLAEVIPFLEKCDRGVFVTV